MSGIAKWLAGMGRSCVLAVLCCVLSPAPAPGQQWQQIGVKLDFSKAPKLEKKLGKWQAHLRDQVIVMLRGHLHFWDIQPVDHAPGCPCLDFELIESGPAQGTDKDIDLLLHIRLRLAQAGASTTHPTVALAPRPQFRDVIIKFDEVLSDFLADKVRAAFDDFSDRCFLKCRDDIIVGIGIVHEQPGEWIAIPVDWNQVREFAASEFTVQCNMMPLKYKGQQEFHLHPLRRCLRLKPEAPPGPGVKYREVRLSKRDRVWANGDASVLGNQ